MKNILIVGYGYLGSYLAPLLVKKGYQVFSIKRNITSIPNIYHPISCDILKPQDLEKIPYSIDALVYMISSGSYSKESYFLAYEQGIQSVIAYLELKKINIKQLIYVSSSSVYSENNGNWVDESSNTREKEHFSAKSLIAGEKIVLNSVFPSTIVRFSGIYGPKRTRQLEQMMQNLKSHLSSIEVSKNYVNHIHVMDCANILLHVLQLTSPKTHYLASDSLPIQRAEIYQWLSNQMKLPNIKTINYISDNKRNNKRCLNSRILESGYSFLYPTYQEGYKALMYDSSLYCK